MVLLRLTSSGVMASKMFTHQSGDGYWLFPRSLTGTVDQKLHMASPCGLGFSQHASWSVSKVSIPEGKKQKRLALNFKARPGIEYHVCRYLSVKKSQVQPRLKGRKSSSIA